jgi:hypothetical protein
MDEIVRLPAATLETVLPDFIEYLKELDMDDLHMEHAERDLAAHLVQWLNMRNLDIDIPFEKELGNVTDHWQPDAASRLCTDPRNGLPFGILAFDELPIETKRVLCMTVIYNLQSMRHPHWQDAINEVLK